MVGRRACALGKELRLAESEGAGCELSIHTAATGVKEERKLEAGAGPDVRHASFIPGAASGLRGGLDRSAAPHSSCSSTACRPLVVSSLTEILRRTAGCPLSSQPVDEKHGSGRGYAFPRGNNRSRDSQTRPTVQLGRMLLMWN